MPGIRFFSVCGNNALCHYWERDLQQKLPLAQYCKAPSAIKSIVNCFQAPRIKAGLAALALASGALLAAPGAQARAPQSPANTSTAAAPVQCPAASLPSPADYQAEAQRQHPDQGVLWELRKGEHTAYLLGTIHLGKLPWIYPGPRTAQALRAAPAIALELNPLDPQTLQTLMQAMARDSDAQQLVMRNNPQLSARMDAMAQALCVERSSWKGMATIPKILTLAVADVSRDGYNMAFGIDLNLAAMAQAARRPILPLETAQEQLDAMGLGGTDSLANLATPDDIAKVLDDIRSGKNREITGELVRHWQSGDLVALETLMRTCNCMDDLGMKTAMLDDRNQRMAERISPLVAKHPKLFIAVGLLHMVGDNNLLQLLQKEGFTVRQLTGKGADSAP